VSGWSLEVGGGDPCAERLAAVAAAVAVLIESEAPVAPDPPPAAYRSRWRRAALLEASEVPAHVKHDGPPWGVH
jgi:hypothetical protein